MSASNIIPNPGNCSFVWDGDGEHTAAGKATFIYPSGQRTVEMETFSDAYELHRLFERELARVALKSRERMGEEIVTQIERLQGLRP